MKNQEGFICPKCMKIFDSIHYLQEHFSLCEIDQTNYLKEDTGIFGILKKAKKSFEDVLDSKNAELFVTRSHVQNNPFIYNNYLSYAFYEDPNIKSQPLGLTINRTDEFISYRNMKLQTSSIETSNLIMRIEKLLNFSQIKNNMERKDFEKSIVEWVQDDLVPMCPTCGLKFGLNLRINSNIENPIVLSSKNEKNIVSKKPSKLQNTISSLINFELESSGLFIKKKHHCRLCGGLICSSCSFMFPSTEANRLISSINSRLELRESLWEGSGNLTWREDSDTSLDSLKSKMKQKEYCIRCCENCKIQIESKWIQMGQRILEYDVITMHKELITEIKKTSELIAIFQKMYLSLSLGETDYSYQEASNIRSDIVNRCQQIEGLGNKFKSKTSVNGNSKEILLFKAICRNAYLFLQNNFATLKYLPTEDEFNILVDKKLTQIQEIKNGSKNKNVNNQLINSLHEDNFGWAPSLKTNGIYSQTPSISFKMDDEDNKLSNLALQIENVRGFIDQARIAKKFNDAEILQRHMIDLEKEFMILQNSLK